MMMRPTRRAPDLYPDSRRIKKKSMHVAGHRSVPLAHQYVNIAVTEPPERVKMRCNVWKSLKTSFYRNRGVVVVKKLIRVEVRLKVDEPLFLRILTQIVSRWLKLTAPSSLHNTSHLTMPVLSMPHSRAGSTDLLCMY